MSDIVKIENLQDLIIEIRGEQVLLDSDVARVYGVETRDVNKSVANNPDKFPTGYVVQLSREERIELVENFHRFDKLKHSVASPKAFTEKGRQKALMQRSGELIAEIFDDDLQTSDAETTIELNFAVLEFKHTIKKKRGK